MENSRRLRGEKMKTVKRKTVEEIARRSGVGIAAIIVMGRDEDG